MEVAMLRPIPESRTRQEVPCAKTGSRWMTSPCTSPTVVVGLPGASFLFQPCKYFLGTDHGQVPKGILLGIGEPLREAEASEPTNSCNGSVDISTGWDFPEFGKMHSTPMISTHANNIPLNCWKQLLKMPQDIASALWEGKMTPLETHFLSSQDQLSSREEGMGWVSWKL